MKIKLTEKEWRNGFPQKEKQPIANEKFQF